MTPAVSFDLYSYSSTVTGSFGIVHFAEACRSRKDQTIDSPSFDGGRWKIQIHFSDRNSKWVGAYLIPLLVPGEPLTSGGERFGKFTYSITLKTEHNPNIATFTTTNHIFKPNKNNDGTGRAQWFDMGIINNFSPHHDMFIADFQIKEIRDDLD